MSVYQHDVVLNYDTSKADASLGAFRARVVAQLGDLSSRLAKIEVFKDLEKDAAASEKSVASLRTEADRLRGVLGKLDKGDVGFKQLGAAVKEAEKELKAAEKTAAVTADRMAVLGAELKAAGIDTKNFAAAQLDLSRSMEAVRRQAALQTARQQLGITGADEARAQINKLSDAYEVLRLSGTASVYELSVAKAALQRKVGEVNAAMHGLNQTTAAFSASALIAAVGAGGIVTALTGAVKAAVDYEQGLARVSSISALNKLQLDDMGRSVVELSRRIGLDLNTAFSALYEIVSSGVPTENAIKVLEVSARAAVAGVSSVNEAAKLGVAIINAYGLQVSQLERVFDIVFQTVKDGVVTLPELSEKLGLVLPAARGAGISLEELSGSIVVLTRSGLNAPRTMVALEGAIKQLSAPTAEASAAMVEFDITYNGLVGTIQQLASKNLSNDALRRLIPDVEGQRAVATLARNYGLLTESVDAARQSAGATNEAFAKLAETPKQQIERLKATVESLKVAIGEGLMGSVTATLPVLDAMTAKWAEWERAGVGPVSAAVRALVPSLALLGDSFSRQRELIAVLGPGLQRAQVQYGAVSGAVQQFEGQLLSLNRAAQEATKVAVAAIADYGKAIAPIASDVGQRLALIDAQVKASEATLGTLQDRLKATASAAKNLFDQSMQGAAQDVQRIVAETQTLLANRQIGELEAIKRIEAARAESYAGQIALLNDYAAKALLAYDREAAARLAVAKKNGADLQKVEIEIRDGRLALMSELRTKYSAVISAAADDERRLVTAVRDAEDEKRRLREGAANFTRELRVLAFGEETKQLRAQLSEAAELRYKAQQAEQAGRLELAQEYLQKAYDLEQSVAKRAAQIKVEEEKKAATEIAAQDARSADERIKNATESAQKIAKANSAATDAAAVLRSATSELAVTEKALESAIDARASVQQKAAQSYAKVNESAKQALDDIAARVKQFSDDQGGDIALRIRVDGANVDAAIAAMQQQLRDRAPVAEVNLAIEKALMASQKLKDDIEKGKPTVEVNADFEKLKADTRGVIAGLPAVGLKADDSAVLAALKGLEKPIAEASARKIELKHNVDEVTAKLVELNAITLNKKKLEVEVVYTGGKGAANGTAGSVPGFASGGLVGASAVRASATAAAVRGYAAGGFVGTVPGVGNTDSFAALLRAGSFVLNKRSTEVLKRALSGLRGGEGGGGSRGDSAEAWASRLQAMDSFSRQGGIASMFNAGLAALDRNIKAYRENSPAGFVEPNAERLSRDYALAEITKRLGYYASAVSRRDQSGADAATGYAVEYAKSLFGPLSGIDGKSIYDQILSARGKAYVDSRGGKLGVGDLPGAGGYAVGGAVAGGGLMPAMLMPGEVVFSPAMVRQIGVDRLLALNNASTARHAADMAGAFRKYADGGVVDAPGVLDGVVQFARNSNAIGAAAAARAGSVNTTNNTTTHHITINAGSDVDAQKLVRLLDQALTDRERRRK